MTQSYFVGLMSGTSLDGLDIALCSFDTQGHPTTHATQTVPLPSALRAQLSQLSQQVRSNEMHSLATADRLFGQFCGDAVRDFLRHHQIDSEQVIAIGSHGQTVGHMPDHEPSYSIQIGCPSTIAALTGIDVIAHFRQKDIALGGQGAPLAPAFHQAMVQRTAEHAGVLNIGGIANITILSNNGNVKGFDTGPGNCLMDSWFIRHHPDSHDTYDRDGLFAREGQLLPDLLARLESDPYFAKAHPKSTGREYFNEDWLNAHVTGDERPADVQRTLLELTATTIATQLKAFTVNDCYLCGGGVHNTLLWQRIEALVNGTPCQLQSTSVVGVEPDWVEAIAFAWLAWCFIERRPSSLASVTGASRNAVLGGLYPAT